MLTMVEPNMILKEKLITRSDNPGTVKYHFIRPVGKECHRCQGDHDQGMLVKLTSTLL